jgi:hypothetical protein
MALGHGQRGAGERLVSVKAYLSQLPGGKAPGRSAWLPLSLTLFVDG